MPGKSRKSSSGRTPGSKRLSADGPADDETKAASMDGGGAGGDFGIVAIGGSSGSLEAMEHLLLALGPETRMGFVFIQHLDPAHESRLAEILTRSSKLAITQARDGDRVTPEHLYVIPPNADLSISDGVLRLTPREKPAGQHLPIDGFFRDLAEDVGERAVGVVLSGSGLDGSHGLLAIKAAGGLTFAQEPLSAKFDSMPKAAIATGEVDLVLPPEQIGAELQRLGTQAPKLDELPAGDGAPVQEALSEVLHTLTGTTGIDLSFYKQANLQRRIKRRMLFNHVATIEQYAQMLRENVNETKALYNDILISVTSFFRDSASGVPFSDIVFPELMKHRRNHQPIRIWTPGCSTGEEAYSLAIGLTEFAEQRGDGIVAQIFATDLRESAIERARLGAYPPTIVNDVSPGRLRRFFIKTGAGFQVIGSIREQCIFAQHNLLADPPFSQLDLVSCRNVLIYFRPEYQMRAMSTFYYALKSTGFLVLGRSESPGASDLFTTVDSRHRVYRKNLNAVRKTMTIPGAERQPLQKSRNLRRYPAPADPVDDLQKAADKLALQIVAPPGVVVNEQLDVVQFRGRTSLYLESPSGEATLNLVKLAREEFRLELQALLYEVRKRKTRLRKERLSMRHNGEEVFFAAEAIPLDAFGDGKFFLVLFHEMPLPPARQVEPGLADHAEIDSLKNELTSAKTQLQAIIEELEATNEEMKAANEEVLSSNEELQSMNEELETAKEELQSANEELTTVNEELQNRNSELGRMAADLNNLLTSVNIPILMLSRTLCIRRYTPSATRVMNLIPSDIGRPITDINLNIVVPDLESLLFDSMETMSVREREVRDKPGRRYILRVQPFKTLDNHIDGVVMMMLDTEDYASGLDRSELARGYAEAVAEMVGRPIAVLDEDQKIQSANEAFRSEFTLDENSAGRRLKEILDGMVSGDELERRIQRMIEQGERSAGVEMTIAAGNGETREYIATARHLKMKRAEAPSFILLEVERKTG
jgi:two-component system CheB/CheR fusion protein